MNLREYLKTAPTDNQSRELWSVYNGHISKVLEPHFYRLYGVDFCKSDIVPITFLNFLKGVIDKKSKLYSSFSRGFNTENPLENELLKEAYKGMDADNVLHFINTSLELEKQCHVLVYVDNGKIRLKTYKNYEITPVVFEGDNNASAFIVKSGDLYAVYSSEHTKIYDRDFNFLREEENVLYGMCPMFASSFYKHEKSYFFSEVNPLLDYTLTYNLLATDMNQIVRMQGFSQAVFQGDVKELPTNVSLGPLKVLFLKKDIDGAFVDFKYVSPSPDLQGTQNFLNKVADDLSSSLGVSKKSVNGSTSIEKFNSGLDRLLSMLEEYEPLKATANVLKVCEEEIFARVKRLLVHYSNSYLEDGLPVLQYSYTASKEILNTSLSLIFNEPVMVKTFKEILDENLALESAGLQSKVSTFEKVFNLSKEEAFARLASVQEENRLVDDILAIVPNETIAQATI